MDEPHSPTRRRNHAELPFDHTSLQPGLVGMVFSFLSGLAALWLLSRWLESGRWKLFGYYCLAAAVVVFALTKLGYWTGKSSRRPMVR